MDGFNRLMLLAQVPFSTPQDVQQIGFLLVIFRGQCEGGATMLTDFTRKHLVFSGLLHALLQVADKVITRLIQIRLLPHGFAQVSERFLLPTHFRQHDADVIVQNGVIGIGTKPFLPRGQCIRQATSIVMVNSCRPMLFC